MATSQQLNKAVELLINNSNKLTVEQLDKLSMLAWTESLDRDQEPTDEELREIMISDGYQERDY